jgi:hypothetical protein
MPPLFLALAGLFSLVARETVPTSDFRFPTSRLVLLVWLLVPIAGSLLVPRASVRFSPKYLIAVTPVYYTLIVLGLNAQRKESRAVLGVRDRAGWHHRVLVGQLLSCAA